ncbi:hypothetical protein D5086_027963 [Populus alba]|uniref:Uncharacterized protein n=1 Tax=Populus alba TaxID=43335 RepID=A0ACC4AWT5_POPAL
MDEHNSLNIRNWGSYEPTSVKGNLGLQLMFPPENPFWPIICICFQPPDSVNHEMLDQVKEAGVVEKENVPNKKRHRPKALKSPKVKKEMRGPRAPKPEGSPSVQLVRSAKKTAEIMINGINIDISVIPIPVCLCMGTP